MKKYYEMAMESASYIESRLSYKPETAVILGSGLGPVIKKIKCSTEMPYSEIPNFPNTTVKGHDGKLLAGMLGGRAVLAMKGRFHYYEGYEMWQVVFPVWVFKRLGIRRMIVTNAAGAVNKSFSPGNLMLINDHISLFAPSPLRGQNVDSLGKRFPDMTHAYSPQLCETARKTAMEYGIDLKEGTYCFSKGPMFETPAEIKALKILGADAVGMSTVPEVIAANHAGIEVMGISCITNMAAGISGKPLGHEEVVETTKKAEDKFSKLLALIMENI